jgi:hypothetical protein
METALVLGLGVVRPASLGHELLKDCKKAAKSILHSRSYSQFRLLAQFVVTYSAEKRSSKLIIKFFYGLGFRG